MRNKKSDVDSVCDQLRADGVTVAEGESILVDALANGVKLVEVHAHCGGIVDAVTNGLGVGPLKDQVSVHLGTCSSDSIDGTVVNQSSSTVDVTLRYELLESDGTTRVNDGLVFVDSVNSGQTVKWKDPIFDETFAKCHVEIDSVRASD